MPPGAAAGRYRLVETLGRGGAGEVCLAVDVMLDRRVALKFLTASAADSDQALEQLIYEARAAAGLDHPFICKIYEVTELDGRPCIAMEYVRGETLEHRLRRGRVPLDEALPLAEEMAEALEAAHERRLVHRDLKPANVMVTESRHIKVMDFGLATRVPHERDLQMAQVDDEGDLLIGTPAYMSPEQSAGRPVDWRSDIFAFGILLYELLSGVHPFRRVGLEATLAAIRQHAPRHLSEEMAGTPRSIGELVARMLEKDPAARFQSIGDVRLELRRLAGELAAQAVSSTPSFTLAAPSDARSLIVGREGEQAELQRAIQSGVAGHGSFTILGGEAGAGKTRLAEDALSAARDLGCLTLIGRCYERTGTPPLAPYAEALEEASRLLPATVFRDVIGRTAPELARLVPDLYRLFPEMPLPLELPPEMQQRFMFDNVREFLTRCRSIAPLVLMLDDLQWADESTCSLTQYLAPHLEKMGVVVIGAYRDVDAAPARPRGLSHTVSHLLQRVRGQARGAPPDTHPVTRSIDELCERRLARYICLGALTEQGIAALLTALAEAEPPAPIVRRFLELTGGNPFFVEELFRHMKDEGRLFDARHGWRRNLDLETIDVPAGVRAVIGRRLQRVDTQAHQLLTSAALIGPYFELDVLEAIAGVNGDAMIAALAQAERAHLVKGPAGRQERRWRFAHQLISQSLINDLPRLERQQLHLRIADAMTQLDHGSGAYVSDIAHHLYYAGPLVDAGRTARALAAAADGAQAVYATDEAIRHYERVLEVLNEARGLDAALPIMQERLADLYALKGERDRALQLYQELAAFRERTRDRAGYARVLRKSGMLHWQCGDRRQATACYERALEWLDRDADYVERAHICQELGLAAFRGGDNQRAIEWAERALAAAEAALADPAAALPDVRRQAHAAVAHATNTIGIALARSGRLDEARRRIEESTAAARRHGLLDVACRGYANLGVVYSSLEPQQAIDVSLKGLELARKIGAMSLQAYIYANLASAYCALTERCDTEGLAAAQAAADIDRELRQLDHLAVPLIVTAQIYQCQGHSQLADDAYREALVLAEKIGEPQLLYPCYDGLATIHLDRGDRLLAEQFMRKAQDVCQRAGVDPDSLTVLPFLC